MASHWEGRVGAEMGMLGVVLWEWVLVEEHWGVSCKEKGSLLGTLSWHKMGAK